MPENKTGGELSEYIKARKRKSQACTLVALPAAEFVATRQVVGAFIKSVSYLERTQTTSRDVFDPRWRTLASGHRRNGRKLSDIRAKRGKTRVFCR